MATKTLSTVVIVIICVLLFPVLIGILGGAFGIIAGIVGGVFGIIAGVFGAVFGAIFSVIGGVFDFLFGCPAFFSSKAVAIFLLVLIVIALSKNRKEARK